MYIYLLAIKLALAVFVDSFLKDYFLYNQVQVYMTCAETLEVSIHVHVDVMYLDYLINVFQIGQSKATVK